MARIVLWAAVCASVAPPALAAEYSGKARVTAGAGVDSNARRDFQQADPESDLIASLVASLEGGVLFERAQLQGSYDGGGRKFLFIPTEDVLVQAADGEASFALGRFAGVGASVRGRDRRGGARDYTDLSARGFVDFVPDASLSVRAFGGGNRFRYWPWINYSFKATEGGLTGRYRFDRRHSLLVFGEGSFRTYNMDAQPHPGDPDPPPASARRDNVFTVGGGYAYRGPFTVSATYSYLDHSSNSYGESMLRHRLTVTGGFRLPWTMFLLAQLNLQTSDYPDGILLSKDLLFTEDEENHNSMSLKLARPVSEHFDLELRVAAYQNRLQGNRLDYFRLLAWSGVTWRY